MSIGMGNSISAFSLAHHTCDTAFSEQ